MVNTSITFNILDFIVRKKLEDQKRFCSAYIAPSDHGLMSIFYTLHPILRIKVKKVQNFVSIRTDNTDELIKGGR